MGTIKAFADMVVRVVGARVDHVPWPEEWAPVDVGDVAFSNAKIRERIGWAPKTDLAVGLTQTEEFFRARLASYL